MTVVNLAVKLDVPVDPDGNPWPRDKDGKLIEKEDPTLHQTVNVQG